MVVREFAEDPRKESIWRPVLSNRNPVTVQLRDTDVIAGEKCAGGLVDLLMTSGQYQHMPAAVHAGVGICGRSPVGPGRRFPMTRFVHLGVRCWSTDFAGPRRLGTYQSWGGFATYAVVPQNAASHSGRSV